MSLLFLGQNKDKKNEKDILVLHYFYIRVDVLFRMEKI